MSLTDDPNFRGGFEPLLPGCTSIPFNDLAALEQALATLSMDQRAAVTLCLAYGFTNEEAAVALRMPLGTVKSHVTRGRDRLREVLGDES